MIAGLPKDSQVDGLWEVDRECLVPEFPSLRDEICLPKSKDGMATTRRFSPVDEAYSEEDDVAPASPSLKWTVAERLDVGIATEEPAREAWETLVNWDG